MLASLEADETARTPGRLAALTRAARELGEAYRSDGAAGVADRTTAVSYALTRMKATAGAMRTALGEASASSPWFTPETHLDLGTGCGAGLLAAASVFGPLGQQVGLDRSAAMLSLAEKLRHGVSSAPSPDRLELVEAALEHGLPNLGRFDLVTAGYCLGELDQVVGEAARSACRLVCLEAREQAPQVAREGRR